MIAKFNNIRPENFERLSKFVESDLNYVRVTRRQDGEKTGDDDEDFDSKQNRVRICKIIDFGKDEKAYHTAMFVDLIMKDWVIDYVDIPGKGWKRVKLPMPREVVDKVFDCLGVLPVEIEPLIMEDSATADFLRKRFGEIADRFAEEREATTVD